MITWSEFQPTIFDPQGAFLDDRQDWLVVPVMQTRDSGPLSQSNFDAALKMLGGESKTVEVYRFNHWGPGWFEVIIVKPTAAKKVAIVEEIERAMADYPVLDDEDFNRREWEAFEESWDNWIASDLCRFLRKEFSLSDAAYDVLCDVDRNEMRRWYMDHSSEPYICESSGVSVTFSARDYTRCDIAALIRESRRAGLEEQA